jgi:hypothetical protein
MAGAANVSFVDIAQDAPYASAVYSLASAGIVNGHKDSDGQYTGLFRPEENVTIAEIVKMAVLGAKIPFPPAAVPSNVSAQGTWASGYVNAGAQRGFAVLRDNKLDVYRTATRSEVMQTLQDAFRRAPGGSWGNGFITRGQAALILASLVGAPPATVPPPVSQGPSVPATPAPVSVPAPEPAMTNATHRVNASANMRSGAAMGYRAVRVLRPGDLVAVTSVDGAWSGITTADGATGFVISTSLSAIAGSPATVPAPVTTPAPTPAPAPNFTGANGTVTGPVNVRTRPDLTAPALLSVPAGTPITILDQPNLSWTHIRLEDGREGYVGTKFVKAN